QQHQRTFHEGERIGEAGTVREGDQEESGRQEPHPGALEEFLVQGLQHAGMTPGIQSKAALGKDEPRAASSERRMLTQRFRFINRGRNQSDRALHPLTVFHGRDYDGSQAEDETVSVVVYRTWSDLEAQLVKGILELYGI